MQRVKPILWIGLIFLVGTAGCNRCSKEETTGELAGEATAGAVQAAGGSMNQEIDWSVDAEGLSKVAAVVVTDKGAFKFKFYPEKAPKTTRRIAELIQQGFYNGLTFHRVVPGFVIQGGDPTGTGAGGSGQNLQAEFNDIPHVKGTVAMARAQDPDSADSQFYVSLGRHPHLDRNYTVFGYVVEGIDVVESIEKGDHMTKVTLEIPGTNSEK